MENKLQGGKELGLLELQQHAENCGYHIPDFSVLADLENEEEMIQIASRFSGNNVIVRSNSVMENKEYGFDGIYKSIVVQDCTLPKLKMACKEVFDSLYSKRATAYRKKIGVTTDSMRIIVQKFIGYGEISANERLQYMVIETCINAQGDMSIATGGRHDFVNQGDNHEEVIVDKDGKFIAGTETISHFNNPLEKVHEIAIKLQKVLGPVYLEGAYIENTKTHNVKVFLFQRRFLPKELCQAQPEIIPERYTEKDILFRSHSYRGVGKIENLPVILMPSIQSVTSWEHDLRRRASQFKSDVILFVTTMALGVLSSRILNDYTVLSKVRAIISLEKIEFSSHAFKVASLAKIPFVSAPSFWRVEIIGTGSLFFTKNEAVFCLDAKRDEFKVELLKKSKAKSLAVLAKDKGVIVSLSEDKRELNFDLNLKNFSFNEFEIAFHRLLEDVSGEVWLLGDDNPGNIGFMCENIKGQTIHFSGWANNMLGEGHIGLDNFWEHYEGRYGKSNQIEWSLIQKIALKLMQ
ncbi:MAG: PEP/pyruvate-binding domain-containing protein [Candidatus Paceibacterota bacterium]|jgi:hypothetical protein